MNAPTQRNDVEHAGGAVEFLLRRMQRSRDFPALSETIRTLNGLSSSSEKSVEQLADVIVRDFALTNKILKVVNSAYYAGFSGKVGTISRALVVLGIEPIRALAASLMLFEHLAESGNAARVKALIGKSMFGALLAREAAVDAGLPHAEEAFLAAMFHNLGDLLVAYYLPDEDEAIQAEMAEHGATAAQAQIRVLGVDLEHVGAAVGRHWNFPNAITHAMSKAEPVSDDEPVTNEETLRRIACLASDVTEQLAVGQQPDDPTMIELLARYADSVEFQGERFSTVVQGARSEYRVLAENLATPEGAPSSIRALAGLKVESTEAQATEGIAEVALPDDTADAETSSAGDPEPILVDGLQEATAMLAEGGGVNQVAQVMLETLFRAFGLRRAALCLRDARRRQYVGRLGFGADIDQFLNALRFDEAYQRDVFHVALQRKTDVHIADLAVGGAGHGIPAWYSNLSPSGSLLFLPLILQDRPVGCIIAEHAQANGMQLGPGSLRLVRALRNQFVLGLQIQRQGGR